MRSHDGSELVPEKNFTRDLFEGESPSPYLQSKNFLERCQSGRMGHPAKVLAAKSAREFESPPLRKLSVEIVYLSNYFKRQILIG